VFLLYTINISIKQWRGVKDVREEGKGERKALFQVDDSHGLKSIDLAPQIDKQVL